MRNFFFSGADRGCRNLSAGPVFALLIAVVLFLIARNVEAQGNPARPGDQVARGVQGFLPLAGTYLVEAGQPPPFNTLTGAVKDGHEKREWQAGEFFLQGTGRETQGKGDQGSLSCTRLLLQRAGHEGPVFPAHSGVGLPRRLGGRPQITSGP